MRSIDMTTLSEIPYLDLFNLQGRFISSLIFYDEGKWRTWMCAGDRVMEMKAWPAETFYFSADPESPNDLWFHFLDFIAQRASYPCIRKPISGLRDDVFNLSASVAKISHLHATKDAIGTGVCRMVVTEIEYMFSVCRSIFDLLQEIISELWESVQLLDQTIKKRAMQKTFSKVVLFKGRLTTQSELMERFGLPFNLADFYTRNAGFFITLRELRNNIIHNGSQVQTIFPDAGGFLIQKSLRPFSTMDVWRDDERKENGLVPLLPALGMVIHKTLSACEDFSTTIERLIQFPPPIVPSMRFFMRGYFNDAFSDILRDSNNRVLGPTEGREHESDIA